MSNQSHEAPVSGNLDPVAARVTGHIISDVMFSDDGSPRKDYEIAEKLNDKDDRFRLGVESLHVANSGHGLTEPIAASISDGLAAAEEIIEEYSQTRRNIRRQKERRDGTGLVWAGEIVTGTYFVVSSLVSVLDKPVNTSTVVSSLFAFCGIEAYRRGARSEALRVIPGLYERQNDILGRARKIAGLATSSATK